MFNDRDFEENFFDDEQRETGTFSSLYEQQFVDQTQKDQAKLKELKMIKDQVKTDYECVEKISKDVEDLNNIMVDLSRLIHDQGAMVESIEDHVEKTMQEVESGRNELKKAEKAKNAQYPAMAAAVGGVAIGGPAGIVASSAIVGLIGAVGGAFAGLYTGRIFKRKMQTD